MDKKIDYKYPKIRLGLCCMNMTLRHRNYIYSSRRLNLKTLIDKGLEVGEKVAKNNIIDLMKMIIWNKEHGISVMRVSSELVPHGTNLKLVEKYGKDAEDYIDLKFLKPHLRMVGELARLEGMRITFHPAQFVQLGSPSEDVFKNSVKELEMHAHFLDYMGMGNDSVIVVHIGGTYCKKKETIERYVKKVNNLPKFIKDRLVFENDEKCYDAEDVLAICKRVKRPMVFDYHHYVCYPNYNRDSDLSKRMTVKELIPKVLETWTNLGIRPKFHLSEQMEGKQVGTHSLFIEKIPDEFLEIPSKFGIDVDIMIEAKGKEVAISKLYQKYPDLRPEGSGDLPKKIPKDAMKDLKMPDEIKELQDCDCGKDPLPIGEVIDKKKDREYQQEMMRMRNIKEDEYYVMYIKYRNLYKKIKK